MRLRVEEGGAVVGVYIYPIDWSVVTVKLFSPAPGLMMSTLGESRPGHPSRLQSEPLNIASQNIINCRQFSRARLGHLPSLPGRPFSSPLTSNLSFLCGL